MSPTVRIGNNFERTTTEAEFLTQRRCFTSVQNGELTEFYSQILICELTVKLQQPLDSPWVADFSLV